MNDQDRFTRYMPPPTAPGLDASHADGMAGFPVFTEWHRREFEKSPWPMRVFDHETFRYLAVNDAAVKFYGYTRQEFLDLTAQDTRHPEEHAKFVANLQESTGYLRHRGQRRHIKKSGEVVVVEVVTQDIIFDGRLARMGMTIDVSGRLRTQELLWQRQQEFETLAENLPDLVARFDRDHRFVYVNSAVENLSKGSRHNMIGKTQRELGMPDALVTQFELSLDEAIRTGEAHTIEFNYPTPGGERQFEAYHVPERDASGQVATVLCVARDITERKSTERALHESNEFLRGVIESSRDCIKVLDLEGRLQLINEGGRRLLEIDDLAPLLNTEWREFWRGADHAAAGAALDTARGGGVGHFEGYCPTWKGSPRWWDVVVTPILGADGKPAKLLAVSRNVTGRKRAQDMQSQLAAIVNHSMDAVISKDLDGIIRTWNPAAERLFGYRAEEAVGQSNLMLVPADRWEEESLILERIRSGTPVESFESVRCRKDGTRVDVSLSISPIKDAAGKVIGASTIARDITERRQDELALLRSAALTRLLESLARAANEAVTPEAAMVACLERICQYGRWVLGRVAFYDEGEPRHAPSRSVWHAPDRDRFAEFIRVSESLLPTSQGKFIARVLRERVAVWMEDMERGPGFGRASAALAHGLKSAFAFPVIVRGAVVAVMEFHSVEVRARDPLIIGAAQTLASQLARIVEREWAHQADARMAALVASSRDAIISRALDGTILTWNPAAERLFGYTADEIVGRKIEILYPPELKSDMFRRQWMLLEGHAVPDYETVRVARDGRRIHVSTSPAPIADFSGKVFGVSTIIRDITERKQAELAVLRSAELARLLESLARAANEALTPEAAMVACLERVCQYGRWVLGRVEIFDRDRPKVTPGRSIWYAPEGNRFDEFIRITEGHVRVESGPFIGRVLRERTAVWIEDWQQKAGYRRWAAAARYGLRSAFAFPVIAGGVVVAIMEVFGQETRAPDPHIMGAAHALASQLARIVEREWAHQANARMAAIVESSHDAIISRALDGTILTWNAGAERLLGYAAAEIVGRNLEILYPPERKPEMFKRQALVLKGEALPTLETVRITKDGRRVQVSLSSAPIRDSSGEALGISTIMRDISERKIAEQELNESRERLRWVLDATGIGLWLNPLPLMDLNWDSHTRELFFLPPDAEPTVEWFWERLHPEDREPTRLAVEAALRDRTLYAIDHRVVNPKTGEIRWIRSAGKAIYDVSGTAVRFDGINYDITDEKQAESERLDHAVRQRDALVREVHHRIKNNLQGVVGLLRQKIRKFPTVAPGIEEAIVQLQTVAVVYGLQGTRADGLLGLSEMVEAICASAEGLIGGTVDRVFEHKSQRPACVSGSEAVSMAVALNELVFNALKHQPAQAGKKRAQVELCEARNAAEIRITNPGRLPKGFDFSAGRALGNGLGLVRTLLASPGASIEFNNGRNKVEVLVKLGSPLLAERQTVSKRSRKNGGASEEKAGAAHPGRG